MTATVSHDLHSQTSRTAQTLLQLVAVAALLVLLTIGAFALGRSTADDSTPRAVTVQPVTQVQPVPPALEACRGIGSGHC